MDAVIEPDIELMEERKMRLGSRLGRLGNRGAIFTLIEPEQVFR